MKPIIEVRNLSKQYKIGQKQPYLSLRDSVSDFFKFKNKNTEGGDFWALDDVSFDVHAGESIGIIGRNGAGKSTLLKILSRITPPTKGKVILRGRIASLLEVGTGFHQELSGRENVFMNGSILGLKRAEIARKFDEIVAFSGVEQFIDTPLKHYSSGMQLRLAFAVAAHLEPEILVIDEVLAVGDAEFQKKCLGKMDEVSRSGRTVLFVSHNLGAVQRLCHRGILLNKGSLVLDTSIQKAIDNYLTTEQENNEAEYFFPTKKEVGFTKLTFLNSNQEKTNKFYFGEPFEIKLEIETSTSMSNITIMIGIDSLQNERISTSLSDHVGVLYHLEVGKINVITARFDNIILHPNTYRIVISIRKGLTPRDTISNNITFSVLDMPFDNIYPYIGHWGIMRINPQWVK